MIVIDLKSAKVLEKKLSEIICGDLKGFSFCTIPWWYLGDQIMVAEAQKSDVRICLTTAKKFQRVLNERLVAHPYEKDQFFAELCRLEDAIAKAESKERA